MPEAKSQRSLTLEYIIERAFPDDRKITLLYPGCGPDGEGWLTNLGNVRIQRLILNTLGDLGGGEPARKKAELNGFKVEPRDPDDSKVELRVGAFSELAAEEESQNVVDVLLVTFGGGGAIVDADYLRVMRPEGIIIAEENIASGLVAQHPGLTKIGSINSMSVFRIVKEPSAA